MIKVCFIGGTRYSQPLDATSEKKFRALSELENIFVIGFSKDIKAKVFNQYACFYLIPAIPMPVFRYLLMFTLGTLLALWCIFRHDVRILVSQSPYEGFAAALAKLLAGLLGKQVILVVESHGDFEKSLFLQRRIVFSGFYRLLMHYAAHFSLSHANILRAVSNSTRHQLEKWAPGKPVLQFTTWTDIEVFLQVDDNREEILSQNILYAGVLTPLKGVHYLINAFSHSACNFPKAQLIIVGREEDKTYAKKLKEQVKQLNLDGQVQFVGEVPQKELVNWVKQATVFVLPSLSEGLPRVVLEALSVGRPVIGSNVGGIPEMIKDNVTGFLIQPGDEKALSEKLRWIFEYPEEAREMGKRARLFAKQFFSTETYVNNYLKVFQKAKEILEKKS